MENIPMNPSRVPQPSFRNIWAEVTPAPVAPVEPRPPVVPMPPAETVPMPVIIPPAAPATLDAIVPEAIAVTERMSSSPYGDKYGELPQRGMLANTYVPYQKPGTQYSQNEGLKKGTLFPGLDLPFKNYVASREVANTPMGELMALGFAMGELGLYLDTHPDDMEALQLRNNYVKMYKEAQKNYEKQYGPISHATAMDGKYTWVQSPWPWEVK